MANNITTVLGAGVNKEIHSSIGLGAELIQDISDRVTDRTSQNTPYLSWMLEKNLNISYADRWSFVDHLDRYRNNVPNASIDGFLNEVNTYPKYENLRDVFMQIGRIAIVFHILGYEGCDTMKSLTSEVSGTRSLWLSELWKFIEQEKVFTEKSKVNLNIITFNYDRILEQFLLLKSEKSPESISFVNNQIHHVYGRIGWLTDLKQRTIPKISQSEQFIEFGYNNDQIHEINEIKNHIQLIYDDRNDRNEGNDRNDRDQFQKIILNSHKILIMGYGFDALNNRRLGLHRLEFKPEGEKVRLHAAIYPGNEENFISRRATTEKVRNIFHET